MTNNQLAENSVIQLLNSVKLARDNAERTDNRVDHSFYYTLTIALEELQERRKADSEPYGFTDGDCRGMIYEPQYADRLKEPLPVYRHAQPAPVVQDELLKEYLRLVECMLSDYRDSNYGDAQRWIRYIARASDDFEQKHGLSPWEMAKRLCPTPVSRTQHPANCVCVDCTNSRPKWKYV